MLRFIALLCALLCALSIPQVSVAVPVLGRPLTSRGTDFQALRTEHIGSPGAGAPGLNNILEYFRQNNPRYARVTYRVSLLTIVQRSVPTEALPECALRNQMCLRNMVTSQTETAV